MDYVKQAEQNILNVCLHLRGLNEIIDILRFRSSKYCDPNRKRYKKLQKGFDMIAEAMYDEQCEQVSKLFMFAGIGGEEALKYSRNEFKRIFSENERMMIMDMLDKNGRTPNSWFTEAENEFRKQAKELIEEENNG